MRRGAYRGAAAMTPPPLPSMRGRSRRRASFRIRDTDSRIARRDAYRGLGLSNKSWKSKLKSVDGEIGCIFARSIEPSGLSAKVTNASARSSRSRHRTAKVSYCQCSMSPTSDGVCEKRITSFSPACSIVMSPYHASVYVPAYFASGSDGARLGMARRGGRGVRGRACGLLPRSRLLEGGGPIGSGRTEIVIGNPVRNSVERLARFLVGEHRDADPDRRQHHHPRHVARKPAGVQQGFLATVIRHGETERVAAEVRPQRFQLRRWIANRHRCHHRRQLARTSLRRTVATRRPTGRARAERSAIGPCRPHWR